jgi:serine/threonine protein kinase
MIWFAYILGAIRWLAPELCFDPPESSSFPSDVWAYGCVILEIITKELPWVEQYKYNDILTEALADSRNAVIFQEICREQQAPKKFITLLCACCTWPKHNRPNFAEIIRNFHSISDTDLELSKESQTTRNSSSNRCRTASPTNIRKSKDPFPTEPLYSDEEDEDYFTSAVSQRNTNSPSLYSRPVSSRKSALRGKTPTNMSYRRQEIDD